jgi:hypothetical protein
MLGGCGGSSLTHTDTVNTSKPLTDVTKDSRVFTPKHRGRESSPSGSDLIRTAAETAADNASIVDQHTLGNVNRKPKADAAEGEQKPADDSSTRKAHRSDVSRPHRLGHHDMSFEAKGFRHRAIAIHQVAVANVVTARPRQRARGSSKTMSRAVDSARRVPLHADARSWRHSRPVRASIRTNTDHRTADEPYSWWTTAHCTYRLHHSCTDQGEAAMTSVRHANRRTLV